MFSASDAALEAALDAAQLERRSVRRSQATGAAVVIDGLGREHDAELLDLSEDGAGLWVATSLRINTRFTLRLPIAVQSGFIPLLAAVVDVRLEKPGVWRIGCRFQRRLSPTELASALG